MVALGAMDLLAGTKRDRGSLSTVLLIRSVALSSGLVGGADGRSVGWDLVCSCPDGRLRAEALDTSPADQKLMQSSP